MSWTKEEQRAYSRKWYLENKERHNTLSRAAREKRKEEMVEYNKKYYQAHKDHLDEISRAWNKKNREKRKEYTREFRKKHGEEYKKHESERYKKWAKNNKEIVCAASRRRKARKLGVPGNGISVRQAIILKDETGGRCVYCGQIKKLSIDHVVPLINGGADDIENAVPACKSCNSKKGIKSLLMFLYARSL